MATTMMYRTPRTKFLYYSMIVGLLMKRRKSRQKKSKRIWIKDWLKNKEASSYSTIFKELVPYGDDFRNYIRMPLKLFETLCSLVQPLIGKEDTLMRQSIPTGARLEASLLFLCSGVSYTRLQYSTRISKQALSLIIPETCTAIYSVLEEKYLKVSKL